MLGKRGEPEKIATLAKQDIPKECIVPVSTFENEDNIVCGTAILSKTAFKTIAPASMLGKQVTVENKSSGASLQNIVKIAAKKGKSGHSAETFIDIASMFN